MKKFILSIFIVLFFNSICLAQDNLATLYGQGSVEISTNFIGSMFGVATVPAIGYFINDNIEVSGALHWEDGEIDDIDYDALGFSLLGLYNFNPIGKNKNLVPFAEVGIHMMDMDVEGIEAVDTTSFLVGGGIRYHITKNFSVNAIFNYLMGDLEYKRIGIGFSVFSF